MSDIKKAKDAGYYNSGFYAGPSTRIPPATGAAGTAILKSRHAAAAVNLGKMKTELDMLQVGLDLIHTNTFKNPHQLKSFM